MRLLLIADRDEYRLLVSKHVEIEWPNADMVEHRLGKDAPLDAHFSAAGFDAVVLVGAAAMRGRGGPRGRTARAGRSSRPSCYVLLQDAPAPPRRRSPGHAAALYGRKIDRDRLIRAVTAASREHKQIRWTRARSPDFAQRYRFGSVTIRGHRCIRQVGSGGMCKIYLAESERAGTLVVLKVFSQVPDVSERIVGFDRFLQEYEIVARPQTSEHRAHLRSGHRRRSCLHRHGAFPGRRSAAAHEDAAPAGARRCTFSSRSRARSRPFMPWACCTGT